MAIVKKDSATFTASEAVEQYSALKLTSGTGNKVTMCDDGEASQLIGFAAGSAGSAATVTVDLYQMGRSYKVIAQEAVDVGDPVFLHTDGLTKDTASGNPVGIALTSASGTGAVYEMLALATDQAGAAQIVDVNENEVIKLTATASAVNELTVANAAANGTVALTATGSDTNISLSLAGKGSGKVSFAGNINVANGVTLTASGTDGFKIGSGTDQYIGFWNATPISQLAHNADPAACASMTQATTTDATAGTDNGGTLGEVEGTYTQATIADNFAAIAARLAQIKTDTAACKTAIDANNAAIVALNADQASLGLTAAS